MELGLDKRRIEAWKAKGRQIAADPLRLRMYVCGAMLAFGALCIERPVAQHLASARKEEAEAAVRADTADDVRFLEKQMKTYEPHLATSADLVEWGDYILGKLEKSGATLQSIEPKKTLAVGPFKVVDIDLTAKGSYEELVDFVDRLERGERIVRLDRVFIQRQRSTVSLECTIKGLVKPQKPQAGEEPAHG
jgi:Tfp pilus assembly protein PilO